MNDMPLPLKATWGLMKSATQVFGAAASLAWEFPSW